MGKIAIIAILLSLNTFAWEQHFIPNSTCGLGDPYSIFIKKGNPNKVVFELKEGGACWNKNSCFGGYKLTDLKPMQTEPALIGLRNPNNEITKDFTYVFFQYCTGDIHIGNHTIQYEDKTVIHNGLNNILNSFDYLEKNGIVTYNQIQEFILYGSSAGALGILLHVLELDKRITNASRKILISDSPGLHFGDSFWSKFSSKMITDFEIALLKAGIKLDTKSGVISHIVPKLCEILPSWDFAVMQGSEDYVMSMIFGDETIFEHNKKVYSSNGIYNLTLNENDNCSSWVPKSPRHIFLGYSQAEQVKTLDGWTPVKYIYQLYVNRALSTHR